MTDTTITRINGRRVWDSRGHPTVEAQVTLACGAIGRAIAPAGASTGSGEAVDLRDGGTSAGGLDVRRAVANVQTEIQTALIGADAADQAAVDQRLIDFDGTPRKSRLGGNAMIAASMAVLHAMAAAERQPLWRHLAGKQQVLLPRPEIQIFGGGAHAARRVDIQDFMVVCPKAKSFSAALDMVAAVYHSARSLLADSGLLQGVADEGGFWPVFSSNEETLDMVVRAIEVAGLIPGDDVFISLDIAASEFGCANNYTLSRDGLTLSTDGMIELLGRWIERYPIQSIEDPLAEDDCDGFIRFTKAFGDIVQVIGDDFLVTDSERIKQAGASGACNAALIKPNQAGTLTETKAAIDAAKHAGLGTIVSARSGETEDVTIVHLAVGWHADELKVGSFSRTERMAKWNEMLRIEEVLGSRSRLAAPWKRKNQSTGL